MIIYSKASRVVKDYNGKRSFSIPAGFIGSVPEWVTKHEYFKLNCSDGTFTVQVDVPSVPVTPVQTAAEKAKAKAEAKAKAKAEAETKENSTPETSDGYAPENPEQEDGETTEETEQEDEKG
ncbi:MAG: hypothetical protein LBN43_00050 [Oscillospiraceae bacterium]|jgi:hypothetical protein|nr:hypothetical protein [Oscillospiraceae bacterium]